MKTMTIASYFGHTGEINMCIAHTFAHMIGCHCCVIPTHVTSITHQASEYAELLAREIGYTRPEAWASVAIVIQFRYYNSIPQVRPVIAVSRGDICCSKSEDNWLALTCAQARQLFASPDSQRLAMWQSLAEPKPGTESIIGTLFRRAAEHVFERVSPQWSPSKTGGKVVYHAWYIP